MNKNRLLFRRGENSPLVNNTDIISYGQPVYNETKNYITVGNNQEKQYKELKPIKVMELFGFFDDLSTIRSVNEDRYFKVWGDGSELQLKVVGKDLQNKNNVSIAVVNNNTKLVLLDKNGYTVIPSQLKVSTITTESGDLSIISNSDSKLFIERQISSTKSTIDFLKPIKIINENNNTLISSTEISTNSFKSSGLSTFNSTLIYTTLDVLGKSTFTNGEFTQLLTTKSIVNTENLATNNLVVNTDSKFVRIGQTDNYRITINSDGSVTIKGNVRIEGTLTVDDLVV